MVNFDKSEMESLQKAQLRYLRNMIEVANSTPVAGTSLEQGILPIQFEIDMRKLNFLCDEEVECTCKTEWCKKVKRTIYRFALNELNTACKANSESNLLPFYSNLKFQEYFTGLNPKLSRVIFKAKLGMFNIKCNVENKYRNNLLCPICSVTDENLQHLTVCSSNPYIKAYKIKSSYDIMTTICVN